MSTITTNQMGGKRPGVGAGFWPRRAGGVLVAVLTLALLCVAASLRPDPRGVETHTQLGLWPCGWYIATGSPCPTCGMTTAVAAAANRSFAHSLRVQPFGFLVAIGAAVAFWGGLHVAIFGSRLGAWGGKLLRPRWITAAGVLLVAAWVYKLAAMRQP